VSRFECAIIKVSRKKELLLQREYKKMNGYDKMVSLSEQWGDAELLDEILRYLPDYKLEEMADSIANDYGFEFEEGDADE
jgi:hypothetical protein